MEINVEEAAGSHYHLTKKDTVDELYEESYEAGHYFCYGNIKKYMMRLGQKGATPEEKKETCKKDLYKIANYALIMLRHEFGANYKIIKDCDTV